MAHDSNDTIMGISRRAFIQRVTMGMTGTAAGTALVSGCSMGLRKYPKLYDQTPPEAPEATVALETGTDRRQMAADAVRPFADQIANDIAGKKVFIKINCNRPDVQLIKTHPDAVRGVLDVIAPMCDSTIQVGEATSASVPAHDTYDHFGYYALENEYNVRMVELNDTPVTPVTILNRDMLVEQIFVHTPFLDPDVYLISVAPMKTHDTVLATLSLKNVVMGSPQRQYKGRMHGFPTPGGPKYMPSPKLLNLNMFRVAHHVHPDLAVIDGVVGAEGNGPNDCDPVDHRVLLAGTDFVATDRIGTELMGIPWEQVAYLQFCALDTLGQGDRDKIKILGPDPKEHIITYKLHDRALWQKEWNDPIDWELIHGGKTAN